MADIIPFPAINRVAKIDNTTLMFLERRDERSEGIPYLQSVINAMAKQMSNNGITRDVARQEVGDFLKVVCSQATRWGYTLPVIEVSLDALECELHWYLEHDASDLTDPVA